MATSMVDESIRILHRRIAYEAAEAGHARYRAWLHQWWIRRHYSLRTQCRVRVMDKVRYERRAQPESAWARDRAIWENTESDSDRAISPLAEPLSVSA